MALVGGAIGVLLAANQLDGIMFCVLLPISLQGILAGGSLGSAGSAEKTPPRTGMMMAQPKRESTKTCPKCGAQRRRPMLLLPPQEDECFARVSSGTQFALALGEHRANEPDQRSRSHQG